MKEININGAVTQCYPLTASQRVEYSALMGIKLEAFCNIASGFYLEYDDVDINVLKECIYDGYEKFEAMRLRIMIDEDGNPVQYIVPREDREIRVVDFSQWREEDAHAEMTKWSNIPFHLDGSPLNEIAIIRLPDHYCGVYMKIHHMTADSSSLISFYSYVLNLYCSRMFENVDPPKTPKSYLEQLKKDLAYEAGCPARDRDKAYWEKQWELGEPIYTPFSERNRLIEYREATNNPKARYAPTSGRDFAADIVVYDLEQEATDRLLEFCRSNHIPVAVLLQTALRTVFSKFAGGEKDVTFVSLVARRGTLLESMSGGARMHFWNLRTIIEPETTFMEALRIVQQKEFELLRHANYDCVQYKADLEAHFGTARGCSYQSASFTYQPMSAKSLKKESIPDIRYKSKWYTNGVAAQMVYVTVMHRPTDDGLSFNFEYQKNEVTLDEVEKLYFYICRALFRGVEDPNRTIGEILEWM